MVKIILISIIKNEEKIIERCITSVLSICDAICITDTGSSDNTCNIVENLFKNNNIVGKLYHDEWKNFGYNRTNAFLNGQKYCKKLGWDLNTTYGLLLDADMKLEIVNFNKEILKNNGYKIIQQNQNLEYYNVRFIKLGFNWRCIGVTHEYWDGSPSDTLSKDIIYINDIGDGGSKNDKFERDIRLLTKGLEEEPNNVRYVFYLTQTLKDTRQFKEAIQRYKQRIKMGGWYEEVWYSYYMISRVEPTLPQQQDAI
jgi:glycosyltransferase involved in cell wall biosynthesis